MTSETGLPEPLTPADCDLRGMDCFPLDGDRLLESELWDKSTGDELKAALGLWAKAWRQVPAGSIPDDDATLTKWAAGWGLTWSRVKKRALHGFVKCNDGRLYHPTVCEKAIKAWHARLKWREDKEADRQRKAEARAEKARLREEARRKSADASDGRPADNPGTDRDASDDEAAEVRSKRGERGEGRVLNSEGGDFPVPGETVVGENVKKPFDKAFSQSPLTSSQAAEVFRPHVENVVPLRQREPVQGPFGGAA